MANDPQRVTQQDADVDQTNNQKVDQGNTQDASHRSHARQDLAVASHQTQVDQQRVTVTVQNHLDAPAPARLSGRLDGRVLDALGAGIANCVVEMFFGPLLGVPVTVEETDRLGRFRVADLPPGFYSLRAVAPDGSCAEQWNLRLDPGGECRAQLCVPTLASRLRQDAAALTNNR